MTKHPRETRDLIKIIGITIKTTGIEGQAIIDISKLWDKFNEENLINKIPNRRNDTVLGLYTDYQDGQFNSYQYTICCEVNSVENVPNDMISKIIPASDYIIMKAKGKFPDCLVNTWEAVSKSDLHRSYRHDFEIYNRFDLENADIDIWVGLRSD